LQIKRYAFLINLRKEQYAKYKKLHCKPWPEVLSILRNNNITNYSIFHRDGKLFGYYEYIGNNYKSDIENIENDSVTQNWWKLTKPCQQPIRSATKSEWWAPMSEFFHMD